MCRDGGRCAGEIEEMGGGKVGADEKGNEKE